MTDFLAKWDATPEAIDAYETLTGFCTSRCLERGAHTTDDMDLCVRTCKYEVGNSLPIPDEQES